MKWISYTKARPIESRLDYWIEVDLINYLFKIHKLLE